MSFKGVPKLKEIIVAGADFSGAKSVPNDTWLAVGKLGSMGLEVIEVHKVGGHALTKEVSENKSIRRLGIDAPFSLPADFLSYLAAKNLRPDYQSWQEVAEQIVFMTFEDFKAAAVAFKKESKRYCDKALPTPSLSPLHRGYPSMLQMTFQCMRTLATLDPTRFFVLPFQPDIDFGCAVMEVYPRDVLKFLGLRDTGYKGKDKGEEEMTQARKSITKGLIELREKKGLTFKDFPRLIVPRNIENAMINSDHALDAVVACYATALTEAVPNLFADPFASENLDVLLEGWIYTPRWSS